MSWFLFFGRPNRDDGWHESIELPAWWEIIWIIGSIVCMIVGIFEVIR